MADHLEHSRAPFSQLEMREMWTYSDGSRSAKAFRLPDGTAGAGSWVLVDRNKPACIAVGTGADREKHVLGI